jgi:RNA polymerase sigma-70 factor (ECF subfamily)
MSSDIGFTVRELQRLTSVAWADVFTRQRARLEAVAARIVSPAEAEDVVQDAFLLCMKHGHTFRGDAQPATWLYRVTVNVALQRVRTQKRRATSPLDEAASAASPGPGADASLSQREAREQLADALADLRDLDRRVVWLRLAEDESTSATAAALHVSPAAVKTRLCRTRATLQAALA